VIKGEKKKGQATHLGKGEIEEEERLSIIPRGITTTKEKKKKQKRKKEAKDLTEREHSVGAEN